MKDLQREILSQVAAGAITAEEGAARLGALEAEDRTPATPGPVSLPPAPGLRQVTVNLRFGNAEIVGDATVATAVADGPHRARQEGDTLVIDQSLLTGDTGFQFVRPLGRIATSGFDPGGRLRVRMNPALALRTRVQAGDVRVQGIRGPITSDVQAGNCVIDGFSAPLNVNVSAGRMEATGKLDGGTSAIRCQMGEVLLNLDKASSVRITAHSTLGDVQVEGVTDQVVGAGTGVLELNSTMGDIKVFVR